MRLRFSAKEHESQFPRFSAMSLRDKLKTPGSGESSLLVLSIPHEISAVGEPLEVCAVPLELRLGGLLLAMPLDVIAHHVLDVGLEGAEDSMIGPGHTFVVDLIEESEDGQSTFSLGVLQRILVVDVNDDILPLCREYDPVTDSLTVIASFSTEHPTSLPDFSKLQPDVKEWLQSRPEDRAGFYSAQEDQVPRVDAATPGSPNRENRENAPPIKKGTGVKRVTNAALAEQMSAVLAQLQFLSQRQDLLEKSAPASVPVVQGHANDPTPKLPVVSAGIQNKGNVSIGGVAKALSLAGPPPRVRQPTVSQSAADVVADEPYDVLQPGLIEEQGGGIVAAIAQQSTAITQLVAHLASSSGDALGDLSAVGQSSSSTKGVQRREKMQSDLANGTSRYFVQMMQQLRRRMRPSRPVPTGDADLSQLSVLQYLERQGGYRNQRELGLIAWILGRAIDAASQEDMHRVKEVLALLMVSLEQACVDKNDWTLSFMLCLLEEPPLQMFQERSVMLQHSKPFGPLVPPQWTAVCLSYMKDLEVLSTKKVETTKKPGKPSGASEGDKGNHAEKEASPKRKPRFPKKPRPKAPAET